MISAFDRVTVVGKVIAFITIFAIGDYFVEVNEVARHRWADLGWMLASLAAAVRCFITAYHVKDDKNAWILFGLACFSWFLGMIVWSYLELIEGISIPFPGFSDIGFLLFAPLILAGLISYFKSSETIVLTVKTASEFLLIVSTVLITLIIVLYTPIVEMKESKLYLITALAYPTLYVGVLVFGILRALKIKSHKNLPAYALLMVALLIHAATDTLYAYSLLGKNYNIGDYLDIFWVIGFGFIYMAAFEGGSEETNEGVVKEFVFSRAKYLEAIISGAVIVWLICIFSIYNESISSSMTTLILPLIFVSAILIATIGWTDYSMQQQLYADLEISENNLKDLNITLENRVKVRTAELEIAKDKAIKASNAKSEFLSHMSHELRTPMNAVIGFSQLLSLDESLSKDQKESVSYIHSSGSHLLSLINDTLDLQIIEGNRVVINLCNIDLSTVVDECFTVLKHLSSKRNISLSNKIQGNDIGVRADYLKLKQVLINIISNAIKYNNPSGSVVISHETLDNNCIRILIADSGTGIPDDQKDSVFDPFVRLNPGAGEGSGVGLTVTKKLVIAMNGKIGFKSTPASGTTFWIDLYPAAKVQE